MKKQSLGILLSLMGAACLYTGCNNDVTPGQEGAECSPACGEMQECVNGECKDLETPPLPPSCDPACGENQECVDGECKDKQTGPETNTCANANETNCDGGCFDLTSDKDNCGECGKICPSGEICENSQCKAEEVEAECQDTDAPTCEGNAVKKCENGHYVTTDCESQTCENGECKTLAECSDDMEPFCDGNAVKSCKSGHYDLLDCQNKACVAGACSDETFEKECDNDGVSVCDNNQVKTCKAGKFEYQNCTAAGLTCETTEEGVQCAAVEKPECTESDAPTCEGNSLKSCVDGKFAFEACPGICENGACKAVAIEDLCPDDASKTAPGVCGCGIPDIDTDGNGTPDCKELDIVGNPLDLCPDDPNKLLPGICGCGIPDDINENSGNPYCLEHGDLCPEDANKTMPGVCGCGYSDQINEFTNTPQCIGFDIVGSTLDLCPDDSNKLLAGTCGCGIADTLDSDKHIPSCVLSEEDLCVDDADKTKPGICGCGVPDNETDSDSDGVPDCIDQCPENPVKYIDDECGCNEIKVTLDGSDFCAIPINSADDFMKLKDGTYSVSKNYVLTKDINLYDFFGSTTVNDWVGIKNFSGKFISNGKTISFKKGETLGTLKTSARTGLFQNIGNARLHGINVELNVEGTAGGIGILASSIVNSTITSVGVSGNLTSTGSAEDVGGLTATATNSTFSNIKHSGDITHESAYDTGGIVGQVLGKGIFTSIESKGTIKGRYRVGGLFGWNGDTSGTVTVSDVIIEGEIKGKNWVGGAIGRLQYTPNVSKIINRANIITESACQWEGSNGGIIGAAQINTTLTELTNYGNITARRDNCLNNSDLNTNNFIGGILGYGGYITKTLKDCHNHGNIDTDSNHSVGGIIGGNYYRVLLENVSNSGKITNICKANECHSTGGIAGMIGASGENGGIVYLKNAKNTGEINGVTAVGGIVGYYAVRGTSSFKSSFENLVNEGTINALTKPDKRPSATFSTGGGGIFGLFHCGSSCLMNNLYNTGDVNSIYEKTGGLFGQISTSNPWSESNNLFNANNEEFGVFISNASSTGSISSTAPYTGGLVGYVNTVLTNKWTSASAKTVTCDNGSVNQSAQYNYYNALYTLKLSNVYSTGSIKGTTSIGSLIGYLSGNSQNATFTNRTYACTDGTPTPTDATQTVKRANKLILANAFSVGEITGNAGNSALGGLVGNYNYANSLGTTYNHVINNVYSTSVLPASGGALFGTVPANVSYKNIYYWPKSGAADVTPSGTVTGAVSFDYVAGVPHIAQDDVDLLNQLNANVKSSSSDELNTKVSATWAAKEHVITGKVKANIPFLEIAPEEMPWEAEQQQEESGRD